MAPKDLPTCVNLQFSFPGFLLGLPIIPRVGQRRECCPSKRNYQLLSITIAIEELMRLCPVKTEPSAALVKRFKVVKDRSTLENEHFPDTRARGE